MPFKYFHLLIFLFVNLNPSNAQKEITVRDIWQDYTFYDELLANFNFQNDGKHYTILERNR